MSVPWLCICKFWVLEIVSSLVAYATFGLLEGFFDHQALFYNAQTVPMSRLEVVEKFVNLEQPHRETHTNKFSDPSSMTQNLTVQP
ncbi:hypothetical protein Bca52824_079997 [Brassica carinata]|uniref:Uncharacterized protein n=1 Tax=Brassica carinata TaxID=52824 RepID=A0A8X7Q2F3_BRACI|nr:hypothetical protein Bca52824_079997 [Brassica carinata]